jgi:signal transduction histidine kinase
MSIRVRLSLYWAAITAAILFTSGALIFFLFTRELWHTLDASLLEEADTAAAALSHGDSSQIDPILSHLVAEKDLGPGKRVRLLVGDRVLFDQGDQETRLPKSIAANGESAVMEGEDSRYRFAVVPLQIGGRDAVLEDGVDASSLGSTATHLLRVLILVLSLFLVFCIACGYWLSVGALRPLFSVRDALARIGPRDLARRLPEPRAHDESGQLVIAINQLLERLEHASEAQRRFVSEAAHELRTPLAVLRAGIEVALERPRDANESEEALRDALRDVERLCATAEELLALARLESGATPRNQAVNLNQLVADAAETVRPLADEKSQSILASNSGAICIVRGDPDQLRRVLLNLLANAIKFAPAQGHIEVSASNSNSHVVLRVADDGPGLDQEELARMFDAFYRGRRVGSDGSGLGLTLCREIIRLHGGTIRASTRPVGGCEIEVNLPSAA